MGLFSRFSTPEIGVEELDVLIQNGAVRVLDVREDWEFSRGRVAGAVNIPLKKLPVRATQLKHDKPYAVICESGSRSRSATNFLFGEGFEGAVSVKGGTSAWARTKRPLVRAWSWQQISADSTGTNGTRAAISKATARTRRSSRA